jgi:hypothetical protein
VNPLAGILALRGWEPYLRHSLVNGVVAERYMLAHPRSQPSHLHTMVMCWPEVLHKGVSAKMQTIDNGTIRSQCRRINWAEMPDHVLVLLAPAVLARSELVAV